MRNLKKVLALVLALMMALSLMATASAADYNDNAAIDYDEAVAVMSAVGVFNGTSGGNFDPDGILNRAQAAKIITYMLLGQTVADALPNTGSKFADCPDGQWYVGSVNYLTDLGIVAGRGANFDPKGSVTGVEFAKMLLGALGYKADLENLQGTASWATNTAILARQAGLDKEMTTAVLNSNALTRQQACQMAFNTMKADVKYYKNGMNIVTPDGTQVSSPAERESLKNNTGKDYMGRSGETTMQFCEMYFPELKYNGSYSGTDDLGRKLASQWSVGSDAVYTGTNKLAAVFTNAASATEVKNALAGCTWPTSGGSASSITVALKGETTASNVVTGWSSATLTAIADTDSSSVNGINEITAAGRQVEVYVDGDNEITEIVCITYTLDTLKRISTAANGNKTYQFDNAATKTNKADGSQTQVVLEGDVNVGDVVTTVQGAESLHVYPTTTVVGKQTVFNSSGVITVAGEKYTIGKKVSGVSEVNSSNWPNGASDVTFYLDINGFVVKRAGAHPVEQFVYIEGAAGTVNTTVNGKTVAVEVRAVLSDGTVGVYDLEVAQAGAADSTVTPNIAANDYVCGNVKLAASTVADSTTLNTAIQTTAGTKLLGNVYQYSTNEDGELVLAALTAATTSFTSGVNNSYAINPSNAANSIDASNKGYQGQTVWPTTGTHKTLMSSGTDFVLITGAGPKTAATLVTGTSGLKLDENGVKGTAVTDGTGVSKVVFLHVSAPKAETVDYVYIDAATFEEVTNEDGVSLKEYTGIDSEGKEVVVYGPAAGAANTIATNASGIYAYDANSKISAADTSKKATSATTTWAGNYIFGRPVARAGGALLELDSQPLNVTDETSVVYLDQNATEWGGSKCYVVLKPVTSGDPTDVAAIFIVDHLPDIGYTDPGTKTATAGSANAKVAISVTDPASDSGKIVTVKFCASSDDSKATVTKAASGVAVDVTGVAAGTATITVVLACEGYADTTVTFTVTVSAASGSD